MQHRIPYAIIGILVVTIIGVLWWCWGSNPVTTIILVRHAEKQSDGNNPSLRQDGLTRANELIAVAGDAGVTAIYSTEFCRTAQTAQPLTAHLGLPLNIKEINGGSPGVQNCTPSVTVIVNSIATQGDYNTELVDRVLSDHRGQTVVIVGHSNTVPELIEAFGAPPVPAIPETEYDNLFVVRVPRFLGAPTVVRATYGAPR